MDTDSIEKVIIGDATLYLADCRAILPTLGKVDAVVTDPPYGIALENHGGFPNWEGGIVNDSDSEIAEHIIQWAGGRNLAVFASPYHPYCGSWRNLLVWDKGDGVGVGGDKDTCWKRNWELIQCRAGKLNGQRDGAVLRFHVSSYDYESHPCQKPVELMEYLIAKLSQPTDTILDPFMGSGTTGVAALKLGRRFVGVEIEPKYFEIACDRIETEYNQMKMF